jgi:hypothetical protein
VGHSATPLAEHAAAAAPGVTRLMSAGIETQLERFEDPALLGEGKVNIIALDAIVERSGARWEMRRQQVYDHVERTLERYLGLEGYFLRVSETDFLICQPGLGRFAGQAACLRYLREILSHFLGEGQLADLGVHQVAKLGAGRVEATLVEASGLDRQAEQEAEREAEAAALAAAAPRPPQEWSPITASDGRDIKVSCTLEPVFELKGYTRIGFRMRRRILLADSGEEVAPAVVAVLPRSDILRIDLATVERGLDRLRAEPDDERAPTLIVPVSYITLSNQRGRAEIVEAFKQARQLVDHGVICEVCDIEGVPQVALLTAISLIRPFCLFVVGRLDGVSPATIRELKGAGLQAISVECPRGLGEAEFLGWAKAAIGMARKAVRSVMIYRTASSRQAGMAALLNATHASIHAG